MADNIERELGWDDEIEHESEYVLVPEGDYDFEIVKFERGRHNGSAKLPACSKAILTIEVSNGKDKTLITHNLFLHSKTEGLLCAFFNAIGLKKHGEKTRMNWGAVPGAKGRCKIEVNNYTNDKGEEKKNNRITKFYEYEVETIDTAAEQGMF